MLGDLGGGVTEFIYSEEGAGVSPFLVRKEKFLSLSAPSTFPIIPILSPNKTGNWTLAQILIIVL